MSHLPMENIRGYRVNSLICDDKPIISDEMVEQIMSGFAKIEPNRDSVVDHHMDLLHDLVDDLLCRGEYETVDLLCMCFDRRAPIDYVLGILTTTLPTKSKLPSRTYLFDDIEAYYHLWMSQEKFEKLFSGLR